MSKLLPKMVYGTKEFEYTHWWNLLVRDTDLRFVLSYQERFPYPELTFHTFLFRSLKAKRGNNMITNDLPPQLVL